MQWLIDRKFKFAHLRETHSYNTRHKDNNKMTKSWCKWGQQILAYQVIHEWNVLSESTRDVIGLDLFQKLVLTILSYFIILSTLS